MGHSSPKFESPDLHDNFTNTPNEAPTSSDANSWIYQRSQICDRITVKDVVCVGCTQLLFQPMVLKCGHGNTYYARFVFLYRVSSYLVLISGFWTVYCKICILHFGKEMTRCQVCQCLLPKGLPKVFLGLVKFLEEHFPEEYALRKDTIQQKEVDLKGTTFKLKCILTSFYFLLLCCSSSGLKLEICILNKLVLCILM